MEKKMIYTVACLNLNSLCCPGASQRTGLLGLFLISRRHMLLREMLKFLAQGAMPALPVLLENWV